MSLKKDSRTEIDYKKIYEYLYFHLDNVKNIKEITVNKLLDITSLDTIFDTIKTKYNNENNIIIREVNELINNNLNFFKMIKQETIQQQN